MRSRLAIFALTLTILGLAFSAHAENLESQRLAMVKEFMLTRLGSVEDFRRVMSGLHDLLQNNNLNDGLISIVEQTLQVAEKSNYSEYKVAVLIRDTMPFFKAGYTPQMTLAMLKALATAKAPGLVAAHGALAFQSYWTCTAAASSPANKYIFERTNANFCQNEVIPYLQQMINVPFEDEIARRRNISAYMALSGLVSNSHYKAPEGFESQLIGKTWNPLMNRPIDAANSVQIVRGEFASQAEFLIFSQTMAEQIVKELTNTI